VLTWTEAPISLQTSRTSRWKLTFQPNQKNRRKQKEVPGKPRNSYHFLRQRKWLVLGVKWMEINVATGFPGGFQKTCWWLKSRHLKNMLVKLGSSSPIFGVKMKNI